MTRQASHSVPLKAKPPTHDKTSLALGNQPILDKASLALRKQPILDKASLALRNEAILDKASLALHPDHPGNAGADPGGSGRDPTRPTAHGKGACGADG